MAANPLAEVFGFRHDDMSEDAKRYRRHKLCPFHNKVPNCTKDKVKNPLGVCSIYGDGSPVVICPVRFRENWTIVEDAAEFFFPEGTDWTSLVEVRLEQEVGQSAGIIDVLLVSYNDHGTIIDYGALAVQPVFPSVNLRETYEGYINREERGTAPSWHGSIPDPLCFSAREELLVERLIQAKILKSWGKKAAIALHTSILRDLPILPQVTKAIADVAWLAYDLIPDADSGSYRLRLDRKLYTRLEPALSVISNSQTAS